MRILNLCFFTFFSILVRSNLTVYSYKFPFSFNILKKIEIFSGNNKRITKQSIDSIERRDYYESSDLIWNDRKIKKFKKSLMDSYDINGIPSNFIDFREFLKTLDKFNEFNSNSDKKKLITITPGGLKGFYVLGICSYIKDNYDLSDYVFSGASAGSWNSLFLSYKYDSKKIIDAIFDIKYEEAESIFNVELLIKDKFLSEFSDNDFDFDRVYIGSTILNKCKFKSVVYSNFESLSDAIDCCIGSSHIPIICGSLYYIYKNKITIDGGISLYLNESPYLPSKIPSLIINPDLFSKEVDNTKSVDICDFYKKYFDSLDIKNIVNIRDMFELGYSNANDNKEALDEIFN